MNHRLRVVTACSALFLAGVTNATDSPAPTMPGHPGDSWAYRVTVTFTNQRNHAIASLIDGTLTRTVLESKCPGKLLVKEVSAGFHSTPGVIGPEGYQPVSISYSTDGTVDKIVEGANPAAYRLLNLETIKLPSVPLIYGLTWSWNADADSDKGTRAVTVNCTIVQDTEYAGIPAWKIQFASREADPSREYAAFDLAKIEGWVWLRKSDQLLLAVVSEGSNLPVPGTSDVVERKLSSTFIPDSEIHAPVITTPVVQGPTPR